MSPDALRFMIANSDMPNPGKVLLTRLLERDRDFRIVLTVHAYHSSGYGLHDEPGSAYDMASSDFNLSISSIRRIHSKGKAILQDLV